MTNPAEVARKLTEAQRDRFFLGTNIGCIARSATTRGALIRKGLAVKAGHPDTQALDWTPLGLQVRDILVKQHD